MTKQADKFVKGAFILSIAGLIAKIVSVFYRIPLAYLTGDQGVGYYHTVYPFYALLTSTALVGIPNTVSKLIAEETAKGKYKIAHQTFKYSLFLTSSIGIIVSIIMILGAKTLINVTGWDEGTKYVIWGLAISPIFIGINGALRGYFQGLQIMTPSAITQIIENVAKVILGISLVAVLLSLNYPLAKAVGGAAIGASLGFICSSIYMGISYVKNRNWLNNRMKKDNYSNRLSFVNTIKKILIVAIPITIVSAAYSIMNLIDSITIYNGLKKVGKDSIYATEIVGQMGKAFSVINVPLTISVALVISIVPAVSYAITIDDKREVNKKIEKAIKFAFMLGLPAGAGIFILSREIMLLLYPSNPTGYIYLQLFSICLVLMILGQTLAGILQGISKYYIPLIGLVIGIVIKTIINMKLVPTKLECKGAIIGSITYYFIIVLINYIAMKKSLNLKLDISSTFIKPIISTIVMAISVLYINRYIYILSNNNTLSTLCSVILGIIIYFGLMILLKGINKEELDKIKTGKKDYNG